jgi:hypothetical protein
MVVLSIQRTLTGEHRTRCLDTYLEKPRYARLSKDGQARRWCMNKEVILYNTTPEKKK